MLALCGTHACICRCVSMSVRITLKAALSLFIPGSEKGRCVASEYFTEPEIEITTENTANILSKRGTSFYLCLFSKRFYAA